MHDGSANLLLSRQRNAAQLEPHTPVVDDSRSAATWIGNNARYDIRSIKGKLSTMPSQEPVRIAARRFCVATTVIAGVFAISRLDFHEAKPDVDVLPDGAPGSGIVDRTEVTRIWLPQGLYDLAKREGETPAVRSHEELQTHLDRLGKGASWYVLAFRHHQADGRVTTIHQIRRPRETPQSFGEFMDAMATVAGIPPKRTELDFSKAQVSVIPDTVSTADPREIIPELSIQPERSP
jgi:hypothetical protein